MKNVLLLGATGAAGSALTKELLADTDCHLTLFARHAKDVYADTDHIAVVNGDAENLKATPHNIVRIQNLNDPNAEFNYCSGEIEDKYWIDTGTLLFAWSGTPGTSFGAFIWGGGKAVLNQHIFQVYPCDEISKQFLKCSFEGHMDEIIERAHGGVGLRHITKQELEKIELLVPPMTVQDDFVAFARQTDKSKFAALSCSNLNLSSALVSQEQIRLDGG